MPHTKRKRHKEKTTGIIFCFDSLWQKDGRHPLEILESICEPKSPKQNKTKRQQVDKTWIQTHVSFRLYVKH